MILKILALAQHVNVPFFQPKFAFFSAYFAFLLCSTNLPILLFGFTHFAPYHTQFAFDKLFFATAIKVHAQIKEQESSICRVVLQHNYK